MAQYRDFIPENIAPKNTKYIGVYNSDDVRVGTIPLGHLAFPNLGQKLYSFGALSDVHIGYDTSVPDFQRALSHLDTQDDVNFICICGDLTGDGSNAQLAQYKSIVDANSADTPVYAITGNHEGMVADIENRVATYTGHPLYYSFTQGNDVFIMVGTIGGESYSNGVVFADGELQWLYETLEANRNKRCFVFQHIFAGVAYASGSGYVTEAVCGNAGGIYTNWCWHDTDECVVFENLMKHYKNVTWFHGHSHIKFSRQKYGQLYANYSESDGYRSVHIPSLAIPRDDSDNNGVYENDSAGSEGYIVDVYDDCIVLNGMDFVGNKRVPQALYKIDTTLRAVDANTFTDSTGSIV